MKKTIPALFFLLAMTCAANAGVATATSFTATSASGDLDGVLWEASTSATAPFIGINLPSGSWDATWPLSPDTLVLTAVDVNDGDFQAFTFANPVFDVYFYIENFDSGSAASLVSDAPNISLVSASPSITFDPGSGLLSTSNSGYNGEGDAVLKFSGGVTSLQLNYTAGAGANGVFYGFARHTSRPITAVPEPSSLACVALCGLATFAYRRRKHVRQREQS